jgi:sugar phosphate isomerase/epimerase
MPYTAATWPIAASVLPFPSLEPDGSSVQDAGADRWLAAFREVADLGFSAVDLTDSWVRPGDLSPSRLDELAAAARAAGLTTPAISVIRRSVIDPELGRENLAYSHRTLEAAARLGCEVVSFGLHRSLTESQRQELWFWVGQGHVDPPGDVEMWRAAVERLRELGRHAAELGLLVSLEMVEDTYLGTADSAVRLVEEIGLPNVGLNPDIGNLVRLHRPIEPWRELVAKTLPYANYWHVKNYARDEDRRTGLYTAVPTTLELGLIDYREAFRVAIASGFQGIICVEHYGGDALSVCATNAAYLRSRVLPKRDDYALGRSRVLQGRQAPRTSDATAAVAGAVEGQP